MNVKEICNREVVIADLESNLMDAAKLMREYHVGSIIIVEKENDHVRPVGIVTDRDIVVQGIAEDVVLEDISLKDIVVGEPVTARESDGIHETLETMRTKGVRRLPVVDSQGSLVGILTMDDLLEVLSEELENIARLIVREQQTEEKLRKAAHPH